MDKSSMPKGLRALLWIARIAAALIVVLMVLVLSGDVVNPQGNPLTSEEALLLALFPIGMCVGYIIAWRWQLVGGVISVACIVVFLIAVGDVDASMVGIVSMLGIPGILFILHALLTRQLDQGEE